MRNSTGLILIVSSLLIIFGLVGTHQPIMEFDESHSDIIELTVADVLLPGDYDYGVKFTESMSLSVGSYTFDGPMIVPTSVELILENGLIEISASDVLIDGAVTCSSEYTGNGFGGPSNNNGQAGSGNGGGQGGSADGGGGGGASYGSLGVTGQPGATGNGGNRGNTYGFDGLATGSKIPSSIDIKMGSVGGGGAGGDDVLGGNGGSGGGAYYIESHGTITVTGSITCNGGNGSPGDGDSQDGSGGGGGGSGGGVLLYGAVVNITGQINTLGGLGGTKGTGGSFGDDGGSGGNGGIGRIKVFYTTSFTNTGTYNGITHFEQIIIPEISVTTPKFGNVYTPSSDMALNFVNANGTYEFAWDEGSFTKVNTSFVPTTPITDGPHTLSVKAYSNTSVLTEKQYNIFIDGTGPNASIQTGYVEYVAGTLGNIIEFDAFDPHAGFYNVTVNGSLWEENLSWSNGSTSYLIDGLPIGLHNVSLVIADFVWNTETISTTVNVTSNFVTVTETITEPSGGGTAETGNQTITVTNSDPLALPFSSGSVLAGLIGVTIPVLVRRRK